MIIAVPLFGDEIAPRYEYANSFLIANVSGGVVKYIYRVERESFEWMKGLKRLRKMGVHIILCSGFNRRFVPLAEEWGIQVYCGYTGDARILIERYAKGDLVATFPGKHRCPRRKVNNRRRHRRRMDGRGRSFQEIMERASAGRKGEERCLDTIKQDQKEEDQERGDDSAGVVKRM